MPRVAITETVMSSATPGALANVPLDTGDIVNDHFMERGARLLVLNSGVGTVLVTIVSVASDLGRLGDIVETVPAGEIWVSSELPKNGWSQTGDSDRIYVDVDSVDARLAAIK